ncbi:hypothetical protein [Lichenicoccus roseus]|uniref:DUF1134 domain-containing protein n=1 Tax=Lichenicoccus roseus TaxID=2683649 RepID=A0A5R9J7D5_9PROT|nr:hypothetical protein [Lichenicoccus roseus]TLU73482.1 hypothetical protein FE263_08850 [Lichenicoccus roseus]
MRMAALATGLAVSLSTFALPALAARDPGASGPVAGHVTITAKAADIGVGYTWGDGVLRFHGRDYHFSVKGVDVAAVGYSSVTGHGRVYHLRHLHDFDGTYAAADGEATLGNGIGGRVLKNGNGVEIRIDDISKGARLSGAAQGIELKLSPQ